MKDAMRTLLTGTPRGVAEDVVGLAALFVLLFAAQRICKAS